MGLSNSAAGRLPNLFFDTFGHNNVVDNKTIRDAIVDSGSWLTLISRWSFLFHNVGCEMTYDARQNLLCSNPSPKHGQRVGINSSERNLITQLITHDYGYDNSFCRPSMERLALHMGITLEGVRLVKKNLVSKGALRVISNPKRYSNNYTGELRTDQYNLTELARQCAEWHLFFKHHGVTEFVNKRAFVTWIQDHQMAFDGFVKWNIVRQGALNNTVWTQYIEQLYNKRVVLNVPQRFNTNFETPSLANLTYVEHGVSKYLGYEGAVLEVETGILHAESPKYLGLNSNNTNTVVTKVTTQPFQEIVAPTVEITISNKSDDSVTTQDNTQEVVEQASTINAKPVTSKGKITLPSVDKPFTVEQPMPTLSQDDNQFDAPVVLGKRTTKPDKRTKPKDFPLWVNAVLDLYGLKSFFNGRNYASPTIARHVKAASELRTIAYEVAEVYADVQPDINTLAPLMQWLKTRKKLDNFSVQALVRYYSEYLKTLHIPEAVERVNTTLGGVVEQRVPRKRETAEERARRVTQMFSGYHPLDLTRKDDKADETLDNKSDK